MKCVKIYHERLAWLAVFSVTLWMFLSLGSMCPAHALEKDLTGESISDERMERIRQA